MDSVCDNSVGDSIIPFSGPTCMGIVLVESDGGSVPLSNGDLVKLSVPGYGEVGEGYVVEVCP